MSAKEKDELSYEVYLDPHATKNLDKIKDLTTYSRIDEALERLKHNPRPRNVKKLWDKVYRIRVGRFRIVYLIHDKEKVILVSLIAPRDKIDYEKLP